ncbi:histidine phosphatase [Aureococcus anophagefferens]|uniref:phosphoglycerate mutase (2,3-diphosphoglycerate-dependent) n=1 Tax=Aureococcus anophagefferens TaxID=44056 RepID=A0ABR1GG13_AURAN
MMRSRAALRPLRRALDAPQREIGTLILLRHGQSIWNGTTATFTGWCDVALTPRGRSQAIEAGELLGERGYGSKITDVFTSELERACETAALAMDGDRAARRPPEPADDVAELVSRKYAPLEKGSAAGSHARWLLSSRNLIRLRSALAPGGVLTRALFDALDENGDRMLTADEIKLGVRKLLGDDQGSKRVIQRRFNVSDDAAVAAIVKRIVRHLNMKDDAVCTLADFERVGGPHRPRDPPRGQGASAPPPPEDVDLPWGKVQPIHQRDGGDDRSAYYG